MSEIIPFPAGKFEIIYADPPWFEKGGGKYVRGAQDKYHLMKTDDICALPVKDIAADNAHLSKMLKENPWLQPWG